MAKAKLTCTTPHGIFRRSSDTAYTHVVVRSSPRAREAVENAASGKIRLIGVAARWAKDFGFMTSWHGSEAAAKNAANSPCAWDGKTIVLGVYPVDKI